MRLLVSIAIFLFFSVGCSSVTVWDGGFDSREFEFYILDEYNEPIKGVTLEVFDEFGMNSYEFPIDEYVKNKVIISNESGVLLVSHKNNGIEFGGRCKKIFIFKSGNCLYSPPEFYLNFSYQGHVVKKLKYSELNVGSKRKNTLTIKIKNA